MAREAAPGGAGRYHRGMTQAPSSKDIVTDLIHHGYEAPGGFAAPQPPVCKASTVFFPNVAAMRDFDWKDKSAYTYGLHGTPTSYVLEERIATLEGGLQCLLVPSGLAAIATVALSLLKTGEHGNYAFQRLLLGSLRVEGGA